MLKKKIKEAELKGEDASKLKIEDEDLKRQEEEFRKKEDDLKKKERLTPWNVDTLSKDGFSKTIINKESRLNEENLTDEQRAERYVN
jgi:cell division cycle protein 37